MVPKNENLLNQITQYQNENQHLIKSLTGIQEELLETQQNFEDESIAFIELEEENIKLKNQLCILGLTYIGARCRALNNFQWIYYRYTHYRNRAHIVERALRECQNHGAI